MQCTIVKLHLITSERIGKNCEEITLYKQLGGIYLFNNSRSIAVECASIVHVYMRPHAPTRRSYPHLAICRLFELQ